MLVTSWQASVLRLPQASHAQRKASRVALLNESKVQGDAPAIDQNDALIEEMLVRVQEGGLQT